MKAKIEWYQEVLELEPSSKVFFPLARLLAKNGQPDDAIATLHQGLDRHPEFIEARLFLIELLHANRKGDQRDGEIGKLARLLGAYPGFWDAWSACLAAGGEGRDTALALAFLAASFRSGARCELSWTLVMEHGLRAILDGGTEPAPPKVSPDPSAAAASSPRAGAHGGDTPGAADVAGLVRGGVLSGASAMADASDAQDEEEEHFSLRTRSMAQVLADQGDLKGALDIYEELLAGAGNDEERAAISDAIRELTHRLKSAGEGSQRQQTTDDGQPLQGKHKLIHMLESLAERLEARVQG